MLPEALAAEVARERVVAGVHDAAAGGAEHRVGLDVGARDDAVLELGRLAPARRRPAHAMPARTASAPAPIAHSGVFDRRSSKNPGGSAFGAALGTAFGGERSVSGGFTSWAAVPRQLGLRVGCSLGVRCGLRIRSSLSASAQPLCGVARRLSHPLPPSASSPRPSASAAACRCRRRRLPGAVCAGAA